MKMMSWNVKKLGLKIPRFAISINPPDEAAPTKMPIDATIIIVRNVPARLPIADVRKLTASLLTPTTRSNSAMPSSRMTKSKKMFSMFRFQSYFRSHCLHYAQKPAIRSIIQ